MKSYYSLLFVLASLLFSSSSLAQEKKPNIIYVLADDLGYGDLGCYGQTKIKTPNIDQMAAQGMRFTQHYAGSSVCGPSRASLLTGKHMGHASLRGNPRWTSISKPVDMPSTEVTVAEELKRAGYKTAIVGKWGMSEAGLDFMPLNQGFDYFYGYQKHSTAHNYYPDTLWENNTPFRPEGNIPTAKAGQYAHDSITSKALQFIRRSATDPFFLYLAFTTPHKELTVPEDSKQLYQNLGWPERPMKNPEGDYYHDPEGNITYAGMVSRMDRDLGRLFTLLRELGIDDNTLVIFTSDNGHEFDNNFFDSNGPLRGRKRDLYEGGIRIPYIAHWPSKIPAGTVSSHIAAFWDFLPTACEIAGLEPSEQIDGISYLPALLGKDQPQHKYLYWEFNESQGPVQAIRKGDWKAVRFYKKPMELYNLKDDLGETKNLASENPTLVAEFEQLFLEARFENPYFPLVPHPRVVHKFK